MGSLAKNSGTAAKARAVSPAGLAAHAEKAGDSIAASPERLPAGGVAAVSHELRNLLTALNLYSDLLAEPGVLTVRYSHMAEEIKLIAHAGKSLLDSLNGVPASNAGAGVSELAGEIPDFLRVDGARRESGIVSEDQLAPVLDSCLPLLAHLAGPNVHVHLKCTRNHGSLPLSQEDLTMILVNLVRNAAEAMPGGGGVWIAIQPAVKGCNGLPKCARIVVEDDGPGIPPKARAYIFESGFTTKKASTSTDEAMAKEHHGLGLAIVRRQVESAGGVIQALPTSARGGARFEIRIPVGNRQGVTKVAGGRDGKLQRTNHKDEGTRVRC